MGGHTHRSRRELLSTGVAGGLVATAGCLGSLLGDRNVNWKYQSEAYIRASLTAKNDLYAVSYENRLYAIDKSSGSERWAYDLPGQPGTRSIRVDDTILLGGNHLFPSLIAVSVDSQTLSWEVQTGPKTYSSPVHDGESVYIGNDDGVLYAVNATTGSVKWTRQFPEQLGGPIVLPDAVLVSTNNGTLYAVSKSGDAIHWKYDLKSKGVPGLRMDSRRNVVYAFDYWEDTSRIDAVDSSTGEVRWTRTGTSPLTDMKADQDNYYILTGGGSLSAVSTKTGEHQWNTSVDGKTFGFRFVDDAIYLPAGAQDYGVTPSLHVLSKDSGEKLWQFELPVNSDSKHEEDFIVQPPLVDDENLFFGTRNGMLYSVRQ